MAKPVSTLKGLTALIHETANDAPNALSVKVGGTTHNISNGAMYVGTASGKEYAAVIIGNQTILLSLDRSTTARAFRVVENPDAQTISKIAKDLAPEPETPQEVLAAHAALSALPRLPKGYRYGMDARGGLSVVADEASGTPTGRTRAPKGTGKPRIAKPLVVKGLQVTRNKTGVQHTVVDIDTATGLVTFKPEDGSENYVTKALRGNGSPAVVPVFWANWQEID